MTTVVHVRKDKYTLYIGRAYAEFPASKWNNPFSHLADGYTRALALRNYYFDHLLQSPHLLAAIEAGELTNQTLGCWCKGKGGHGADCHGDVLAALADGSPLPDFIQDWDGFCQKYGINAG